MGMCFTQVAPRSCGSWRTERGIVSSPCTRLPNRRHRGCTSAPVAAFWPQVGQRRVTCLYRPPAPTSEAATRNLTTTHRDYLSEAHTHQQLFEPPVRLLR